MVFELAAGSMGEDHGLMSCAEEASKCLYNVMNMPRSPPALMVFETLVGSAFKGPFTPATSPLLSLVWS